LEGRQEGFEGEGLEFFGRIGRFGDGVFKNWNGRVGEGFHAIALIPQKIIPETIIWKAWNFMIATKTKVWHNSLKSGSGGIGIVEGLFTFAAQRNLLFINKNFRTMRKIITMVVAFALVGLSGMAQAPNWEWAKSYGGINGNWATGITTDDVGNVYMTGYFGSDSITFGTLTLQGHAGNTIFLVKFDINGNAIWGRTGYSWGCVSAGINVDVNGNIYITGTFRAPNMHFDSLTVYNNNYSNYNIAQYLIKYDTSGNTIWGTAIYTNGPIFYNFVSTDASGNVYLAGGYDLSPMVIGTTSLYDAYGHSYIFIAKYDSSGNAIWAKSSQGSATNYLYGITTDVLGNTYITGGFELNGYIIFDSDTLYPNQNSSNGNLFLTKYDTYGNVIWAKTNHANALPDNGIVGAGVCLDHDNNVCLTGFFAGDTIELGSSIIVNNNYNQNENIFIAKYDSSGNVLWAKSVGGLSNDQGDYICTDASNNIYVSGFFTSDSISFGSTMIYNHSIDSADIFIVKYDASGNIIWAKSAGGTNNDVSSSMCVDIFGSVYLAGFYNSDSIVFDAQTIYNDTMSGGLNDIFFAKINTFTTGFKEISQTNSLSLYPNPTTSLLTISLPNTNQKVSINLYDMLGQLIIDNGQLTIDNKASSMSIVNYQLSIEKLPQGIYFLEVLMDGEKVVKKVIKL